LTLNAVLTVTWDVTIENGGILTHTIWASTNLNLQVWWTLTINTWWKIDTTWKSSSTTWAW
jgi:hypothetical protein